MNYYNEFDPHAAAWLQGLIDENLIPPGHIDTRSITEISPSDLDGYTQCHFFAGIGGWPLALQLAGVPATRPLWTGSCPCQPFSVAGEGKGIEDERHLWPVFFALIRACNPPLVFGEQVASAAVLGSSSKPSKRGSANPVQPVWLDGVFADLESASYACGASDIPAAGVGAPHIRQRLWWGAVRLADPLRDGQSGPGIVGRSCDSATGENREEHRTVNAGRSGRLADSKLSRREATGLRHEIDPGRESESGCAPERLADAERNGGRADESERGQERGNADRRIDCRDGAGHGMGDSDNERCPRKSVLLRTEENGRNSGGVLEAAGGGKIDHWGNSYFHPCRDGKYRRVPVEPGLFPLADGLPYKVARRRTVRPPLLRGSGNAIVPEVGAEFVKAFLESI